MRGNIWCRGISRRCANNFRKWSNFSRGVDLLCTNCAAKLPLFALILRPSTGLSLPVCWPFRPCGLDLPPFAACRTLEIIHFVAFCPRGCPKIRGKHFEVLTFCRFWVVRDTPPARFRQAPRVSPPKFAVFQASKIRDNSNHRNSG